MRLLGGNIGSSWTFLQVIMRHPACKWNETTLLQDNGTDVSITQLSNTIFTRISYFCWILIVTFTFLLCNLFFSPDWGLCGKFGRMV